MLKTAAPATVLDLAACTPAAALSSTHRRGAWHAVPFEAAGDICGTLLYAGQETNAPAVTLPLDVHGWHRIHLGLWSNWTTSTVRVKLSGDRAFSPAVRERSDNFSIDERFWRDADLTGQSLQIAQQTAGVAQPACLAYVRLVPLDGPPPRAEARPLIAMDDAFSFFHLRRPTTEAEIWEEIQPYLGTDITRLFWGTGVGGDMACFDSRQHPLVGQDLQDYPRPGDRYAAESLATLTATGIDPLASALRFAREGGLEFHVGHRMEAFQMCAPFDEFFTGRTWQAHPEWRCRDLDGEEIGRLSYAFPGVRDLVLGVFREVLERYDVDGLNPLFNRGAPFLLYEEPLIEAYGARRGLDPPTLNERDEGFMRFRASVMTGFMRDLRTLADEAGARRGRRVEISPHVLNDLGENLFYGLDLAAWVREGLVDRLIAYPWRDRPIDVAAFVKLTRGTGVEFFPDVMPRFISPEEYRQRARELYAAGVTGLCFWDTDQRCGRLAEWSALRQLGRVDDSENTENGEGEKDLFRTVPMRRVGGFRMDKYPPHWAF